MSAEETLDRIRELTGVSRETTDRLTAYADLLEIWNPKINLYSKSDSYRIWTRHILDSAQLWPHNGDLTAPWADFGSGGGFPGLVTAIIARELAPALTTTLIESDTRKSVFLTQVIHRLDLNARVVTDRIERLEPLSAATISARALASLPKLLGYCHRHQAPGAVCLLLKGRTADAELTEAANFWTFDVTRIPSLTDPEAVLLKIGALARA